MRPADPRLRPLLAPARRPLTVVVAGGVAGSALVLAQAWCVAGLVVALVGHRPVTGWAGAVALVYAARALVGGVVEVAAARAAGRVGTALRARLLTVLLDRPGGRAGERAALLTRGVTAAEPYLTRYVPALVLAAVLPPLTLVAIATQDWPSALVVGLTLPLVPVFGALVGLATRDRAERQWRVLASLSGHFLDVVRGLPTLVAFRRAEAQVGTIRAVTERYRRASLSTLRLAFASSAVLELVATLSVATVAVTVGTRLAAGHLDLRTALVVLLLAPEAYWPLRRVGQEFHAAAEGVATFEEALAVLAEDGAAAEAGVAAGGELSVHRATVRFPGRSAPALHDVSVAVPPRGVTAVVGPSGAGKSTLLSVLAGLREPDEGTVRPAAAAERRRLVALLPQRPVFVAGSVADNLRLAAPDATDDELWAVLRRVALEERVRELAGGLDTSLAEDGASLSAGERARLALARVVLSDRPWVLLDEPTAHLDPLTEHVIADTLLELARDRAVVVVAHRPALVELADRVVHLEAAPAVEGAPAAALGSTPADAVPADAPRPGVVRRGALAWSALLGGLASVSGVALTATSGWLIVQASTHPPVLTLMVAIVGVRTFGLARPLLRYAERLVSHDAALALLAERRSAVYAALVPLVPGRLGSRRGEVLASVVDDVDSLLDRELRSRLPLRGLAVVALAATALAGWLAPAAALLLAGVWLVAGAAFGLARGAGLVAERAAVELRGRLSGEVVDALQTRDELAMWQAAAPAVRRVTATSDALAAASVRAARVVALARGLALVACGAVVAVAGSVAPEHLSAPLVAMLVLLPVALGEVVPPLADAGLASARAAAASARLTRLLGRTPAVAEPARPERGPDASDLVLDRVGAGWGDQPVLRDVSLAVPAGSKVALVGPSGCGKSTLAALLVRFLDPRTGHVTLGGTRLTDLRLDDVRRRVGLVDDDPHVFATTVAANLRLARPDATDADLVVAVRRAGLSEWLSGLDDGLDTRLGEGGSAVSGGERARLGLARCLLADQPVVVLDEPTAHLDHATAERIAREVLGGTVDRTVVWISHEPVDEHLVDHVLALDTPPMTPARNAT